jgi:hypothetical protein
MRLKANSVLFLLGLVLLLGSHCQAMADDSWFVSLYGGRASYDDLANAFSEKDFVDSYVAVLAVGKGLADYKHYLRLEGEGQVAKHWGEQDHFEFNALLGLRWLPFPWDRYLDTSFAMGAGLSYATDEPEIEVEKNDRTARLLGYLMFELAMVVPRQPNWTLFARVHHRSGAFGLFDGVSGGSNVVGAGLRYTF